MEEVAQKGNGQRPEKGSIEELKAALGIGDIRFPEDGSGCELDLREGGLLFNLLQSALGGGAVCGSMESAVAGRQGEIVALAAELSGKLKDLYDVAQNLTGRLQPFVRQEPKACREEMNKKGVSCQFGEWLHQQISIVDAIMDNGRELLRTLEI